MAALTSFVGRRAEMAQLADALTRSRLVTLTGPGGIGKTRLAREFALRTLGDGSQTGRTSTIGTPTQLTPTDRYPDGAYVVELETARPGDDLAGILAEQLALSTTSFEQPVDQLRTFFGGRGLLLVLDNCEHVLAECRRLLVDLLAAPGGSEVLATSREPLRMAGERVVALRPLQVPDPGVDVSAARGFDALTLLEQRAGAVVENFRLDDRNIAAAVQVCARLDGLPLPIELAAGRLRSLSLEELAGRLDDRFATLSRGDATARAQHRSLRAMVEWSWDLCSAGERQLWAQLSVFVGGADLEAIEAVCDAGPDGTPVLDLVDSLVGKSVLSAEPDGSRMRYRMLETLHRYGQNRLEETGTDADTVRDRHAAHYRSLAARATEAFYSADQLDWMHRLAANRANLGEAFERLVAQNTGNGRDAAQLATSLRNHSIVNGSLREGQRRLTVALDRYRTADATRVAALLSSTLVAIASADIVDAARLAAEARSDAAALGAPEWVRRAELFGLLVDEYLGVVSPSERDLEQVAAAMSREVDDLAWLLPVITAHALLLLAADPVHSESLLALVREQCEVHHETCVFSYAMQTSALGYWWRSDTDAATSAALRAFELNQAFDDQLGASLSFTLLGAVSHARGDDRRAAVLQGAAASCRRRAGAGVTTNGPAIDEALRAVEVAVTAALGDDEAARARAEGESAGVEAMRALAYAAPRSPPARDGPDRGPLTVREFEVAGLVATGATNQMIADRLVLSRRTIDGHLERILAKLGFRSRAEVAVWFSTRERAAHEAPDRG